MAHNPSRARLSLRSRAIFLWAAVGAPAANGLRGAGLNACHGSTGAMTLASNTSVAASAISSAVRAVNGVIARIDITLTK
jgi:hypothetical protein